MRVLHELGQVVATPAALDSMRIVGVQPVDLLTRHAQGDWDEMDPEDIENNRYACEFGERVFSSFTYGNITFWVITEHDRSATTLMLPDDY